MLVLSLTALGAIACGSGRERSPAVNALVPGCAEDDRGDRPATDLVVIPDDETPPCRLVLDSVVIRRYSAAEIDSLDLSKVRAIDRHGNFYVQGYTPGVITVLSQAGDLIARFGHEGAGPGEFPGGTLLVQVSGLDSVYVRDNRLNWTVFGPDFKFIRSMSLGSSDGGFGTRCVLPDGSVMAALEVNGGTDPVTLGLIAPDGRVVFRFAKIQNVTAAHASARRVSCTSDGTVWALPSPLDPGYRVEHWRREGTMLSVVSRLATWFDARPPMDRSHALESKPPSEVRQVIEADQGLLFVLVASGDDRWRPVTREEWDSRVAQQMDARYEALDVITGQLLGVLFVDDPGILPNVWAVQDGRSYEFVVDDSGGATLTAYQLHLENW